MAGAFALGVSPASAQMYPGQDVIVNPAAIGEPQHRNLPPVHLHPPPGMRHHRTQAPPKPSQAAIKKARPAPQTQRSASRPAPAPSKPAMPAHTAKPPPAKAAAPAAIPFSFGGSQNSSVTPSNKQAASPAPARHKTASAAPLPKITPPKGLSKQADVLFDENSTTLSNTSTTRLSEMAFSLKTALANGAHQIELIAYGGHPGDKSSAARRISLKRALAVREALIGDGVPANRIDVRALGGVTDNGPTDRVDIFVKS